VNVIIRDETSETAMIWKTYHPWPA